MVLSSGVDLIPVANTHTSNLIHIAKLQVDLEFQQVVEVESDSWIF